jgi:hypothetical protein
VPALPQRLEDHVAQVDAPVVEGNRDLHAADGT